MKRSSRILTGVAALVSVATLGLCVVMAVKSLSGAGLAGCAAGSACDDVMSGRWARVLGIVPVSALAAGVYLALTLCLLCVRLSRDEELVGMVTGLLPVFSGVILGSAVWFIGLMLFEEEGLCRYCLAAHGLGLVVSALILIVSRMLSLQSCCYGRDGSAGVEDPSNVSVSECQGTDGLEAGDGLAAERWTRWAGRRWAMFFAGVAMAAVLAVVQSVTAPSMVYQKGAVREALPVIDAAAAPCVGDPSRADYIVELLFDYQCSHCQKVHSMLPEVVARLDGRVAFVLCPCPLSAKCNPYVPREDVRFEGSCELAKIGLAVFGVDPEAFAKYDAWMFEAGEDGWWPRGVEEARAFAEGLVGAERLAKALESQWILERLLQTYELFGRTSAGGQGGIPRFISGERWVVPEVSSAEELAGLLSAEFGIL